METRLLTLRQCALLVDVPYQTMLSWRRDGKGPRAIKFGPNNAHVRVRPADLEEWLDTHLEGAGAPTRRQARSKPRKTA